MIPYLPILYENETIYSLLTRAYEKGGYLSSSQARQDFFKNGDKTVFDFMFYNKLSDELIRLLKKDHKWSDIIQNHTLYNYYARFLSVDKRIKATKSLLNFEGRYNVTFGITSRSIKGIYLSPRYCPICAKEQQEKYGEAYWDRIMQIPELTVCPIHKCKILKYENGKKCKIFYSAENINDYTIEYGSDLDEKIAEYIYKTALRNININKDMPSGKFLVSKMNDTKYLSKRGKVILINVIYDDLKDLFKNVTFKLTDKAQISHTLRRIRTNPYDIIQISILLDIPIDEMLECKVDKMKYQKIEEAAMKMFFEGENTSQISKKLNISSATIREIIISKIGYEEYKKHKPSREELIKRRREIWISETKKYEGLSYSKIRELSDFGRELNWLRRNDKEWTKYHYPKTQ